MSRQLSRPADGSAPGSAGDGPGTDGMPSGRVVIEALVVTAVLAALAVVGWHVLSPDVFAEAVDGGVRVSTAESGRRFGIEVSFAVVTSLAGLVAGAWLMARHQSEAVPVQVVLAVTGVAGAGLVWRLGRATGPADLAEQARAAEPGTMLEMPLDVASYAMLAVWPIVAVVAGAIVIAIRDRPPGRDGV